VRSHFELHRKCSGAGNSGRVCEFRTHDRHVPPEKQASPLGNFILERDQEAVACLDNLTAENEHFGIEYMDQSSNTSRQLSGRGLKNSRSQRVA
jgi:hypothetical protein